ncbi:MAG: phage tail protein [Gammaproteobacteria bacterium]|nr:phage tail protein [Gammaproteobacteria bacterium]
MFFFNFDNFGLRPRINGGVSVGTIVPYAGPVDAVAGQTENKIYPGSDVKGYDLRLELQGWLVCDGRAVAVCRYPELFRVIGNVWGKKDTGHFYLPDLRGRFVRGVNAGAKDDGKPRDPQADERKPSQSDGWKGNQVGSVQQDALETHVHNYQMAFVSGMGDKGDPVYGKDKSQPTSTPLTTGTNPARVSTETRPKNIAVNFLIRYSAGTPRMFHMPGMDA